MIQANCLSDALHIQCDALTAAGVVLSGPVQCTLKAGEIYVLTGANGAGKTTLLRGLANALPGQASLFKPEFGLRDELLVGEQLELALAHVNCPPQQHDALLHSVGLTDWEYERVGTLSSGQRARLGLCMLMSAKSRVWLLDEPLNALDTAGIATLAKAMNSHLQAGGFVYLATHVDVSVLTQYLQGWPVHITTLSGGRLLGDSCDSTAHKPWSADSGQSVHTVAWSAQLRRDWRVLWGNPQTLLWGALFHWMVLGFFGIALGKSSVVFAQATVWVSLLLALMLGAKDWFAEDQRVGWFQFLWNRNPDALAGYWLARVLVVALCQVVVMLPVTGLAALQFGLNASQSFALLLALAAGIWAATPLLGLLALLVMLTRGGAVLVYLLALPLLVPVLIFGLEASQAVEAGRSALAPLAVLSSLGMLLCLLGPAVAKRLVGLIQE